MSKAKSIGTRAESRVVAYLKEKTGQNNIHRRELHGACDLGDIVVDELNIILEVKAGKQTQNYSRAQFESWAKQAITERANASALRSFLVIVEYNRPMRDAKVFEFNESGQYNFCYLDCFAEFLKDRYARPS